MLNTIHAQIGTAHQDGLLVKSTLKESPPITNVFIDVNENIVLNIEVVF